MAKVFIEESTLTAIGNAIREKTGKTELLDPALMSSEIASITTGGGSGLELPEEALTLTGDCSYRFAKGGWDWFIETYGDRIVTKDITYIINCFDGSNVSEIPFVINIKELPSLTSTFSSASKLSKCPKVRGSFKSPVQLNAAVSGCSWLRDIEDLLEPDMLNDFSTYKVTSSSTCPRALGITNCRSLRKLPSWWNKFRLNTESTAVPLASNIMYYQAFSGCYVLDEVVDLPVWVCTAPFTSNMFNGCVSNMYLLKKFTFETDSGQPIVANWKTQTLDFSSAGFTSSTYKTHLLNYNSGITADKEVNDDATYQALKNDPDWFSTKLEYSKYNLASATETINSLPDTSAYLATAGGTNTIKFKKNSGINTDGGGITADTMAEASAIAASKGWTVTIA